MFINAPIAPISPIAPIAEALKGAEKNGSSFASRCFPLYTNASIFLASPVAILVAKLFKENIFPQWIP